MARTLLCVCACVCAAAAFNVDTKYPIVYEYVVAAGAGDSDGAGGGPRRRDAYFGYSVLLYASDGGDVAWLLVGAPRGNSSFHPAVAEPGAVYRCEVMGLCREVEMDVTADGEYGRYTVDRKEHGWLGATMVGEAHTTGRIVVCAPRWSNAWHAHSRHEYHITGICYWFFGDVERPPSRLLPTVNKTDSDGSLLFRVEGKKVYYYAMSQAGMSLHQPTGTNYGLVIGAPGLVNWRGGIALYDNTKKYAGGGDSKRDTNTRLTYGKDPVVMHAFFSKVRDYQLFGYQVASGRFLSKTEVLYAGSSMRGQRFRGYVYILKAPPSPTRDSYWDTVDMVTGQQMGEGFGYSLVATDINSDGYDDLVVGAPLFELGLGVDTGRVFVFLGAQSKMRAPSDVPTVGITAARARFGSALAALGDIDGDSYNDVAVGAPYEEGGGAVYIYHGTASGLAAHHSQRVVALVIDGGLRGFGASIATPRDVDGNNYGDLAIGSFLSGHAVILRTSQVVVLDIGADGPPRLHLNDTAMNIRMCHRYFGKKVTGNIRIMWYLTVDHQYGRTNATNTQSEVVLAYNRTACHTEVVALSLNDTYIKTLEFTVRHDIRQKKHPPKTLWIRGDKLDVDGDHFCPSCPVVDESRSVMSQTAVIPIALECDDCVSDLRVFCDFRDVNTSLSTEYTYVVGWKRLELVINVTNSGDTSYNTAVTLPLPLYVNLGNLPPLCEQRVVVMGAAEGDHQLVVICKLDNGIIRGGQWQTVVLPLDMVSVDRRTTELLSPPMHIPMEASVKSSSRESRPEDNVCVSRLRLLLRGDVRITGSPVKIFSYIKGEDEQSTSDVNFDQTYQVRPLGTTPIKEVLVHIHVPTVWSPDGARVVHVLNVWRPTATSEQETLQCTSETINLLTDNDVSDTDMSVTEVQDTETVRERRSTVTASSADTDNGSKDGNTTTDMSAQNFPTNRTLFLNCSTPTVKCHAIKCRVYPSTDRTVEILLRMSANVSRIAPYMAHRDIIMVSTVGEVSIVRPTGIAHDDSKGPRRSTVRSVLVGDVPVHELEAWQLLLAVLVGVLLLTLLVLGLVKAGFFQRKTREELQALKSAQEEFNISHGNVQPVQE